MTIIDNRTGQIASQEFIILIAAFHKYYPEPTLKNLEKLDFSFHLDSGEKVILDELEDIISGATYFDSFVEGEIEYVDFPLVERY